MNARWFVSAFSFIAAHAAYGPIILASRAPSTFLLKTRTSRSMDPRTEIFQTRMLTNVSGERLDCISSIGSARISIISNTSLLALFADHAETHAMVKFLDAEIDCDMYDLIK